MTWAPLTLWRAIAMDRWKRLVRWLARDEIAQAYETGSAMTQALAMQQSEMLAQAAYANGQCAGRHEVMERLDAIVAARTAGFGDYISEDDLAKAKRGLVH